MPARIANTDEAAITSYMTALRRLYESIR